MISRFANFFTPSRPFIPSLHHNRLAQRASQRDRSSRGTLGSRRDDILKGDRCNCTEQRGQRSTPLVRCPRNRARRVASRAYDVRAGSNYPGSVLFHYGKSRLHFFRSLRGTRGWCPIWRIAWKEGHLITCSRQSCPALAASRRAPRPRHLGHNPAVERGDRATKGVSLLFEDHRDTASSFSPFSLHFLLFLFLPIRFPPAAPRLFSTAVLLQTALSPSRGRLFNRA